MMKNIPAKFGPEEESRARLGADIYARELAKVDPSIARVLAEGYEVGPDRIGGAIADAIVNELGNGEDVLLLQQGTPAFDRAFWDERTEPRESAFATLERARATIARVQVPDGWEVGTERIARFRADATCSGRNGISHDPRRYAACCRPVTSIVIYIRAPIAGLKDRYIVVNAEGSR